MSKQTAAPPSRAGAEEQSSTSVIDAPAEVDQKQLARERDEAKERQKDRFAGLNQEQLIDLYRQMLLIRRFEEKSAEAYVAGKIGGFCHLYIGQEAVAVGAISAVRKDDYVFASYREHGHALAKGMSARPIMAELFGKATGCSKGKGGSMHMFDKELGFLGGHAIVGGQIPLATGAAFSSMYQGTDQVTLCFFGEAAVNQGAFHESLNMAQLWKLPCIYRDREVSGTRPDQALLRESDRTKDHRRERSRGDRQADS
jgi:pyruvate dehydrogenase E1 component alpha subunit